MASILHKMLRWWGHWERVEEVGERQIETERERGREQRSEERGGQREREREIERERERERERGWHGRTEGEKPFIFFLFFSQHVYRGVCEPFSFMSKLLSILAPRLGQAQEGGGEVKQTIVG